MLDGDAIEKRGWVQGKFLSLNLAPHLLAVGGPAGEAPDGALYLVVSQSCDLVHGDGEAEPWCEVLRAVPIASADSLCEHGRNPRVFHFSLTKDNRSVPYEIRAKDRLFLPRGHLVDATPANDASISSRTLDTLTAWLANRYTRPALPTAFNLRLKADKKRFAKLKKLIESKHMLVRDFFLKLHPLDEITDATKSYRIVLLMVAHDRAVQAIPDEVRQFAQTLTTQLTGIDGIDLVEPVKWQSDTRTSLRQTDDYIPWDIFDYLTTRDDGSPSATIVSPVRYM
jgi:hypothetical protein